jgi:hypothetical protein
MYLSWENIEILTEFWCGNYKERGLLERLGPDGRKDFEWVSQIQDEMTFTGFIWLEIITSNWLLRKTKALIATKSDLNLRNKLVQCYIWSIGLYGAETWTLREVDQKYLERVEMRCWRRMEKISWTSIVRNEGCYIQSRRRCNSTIITPTKCTLLLLKAPDMTICTLCLIFCPYMFQPAWVIFRGLNASAWLKLLLIAIY